MYQSHFVGTEATKYQPASWIVDFDWPAIAAPDVAAVIIRVGIGLLKDPCFDRYLAGLKAIGKPWGIYHAFWPGISPVTQAQRVKQWCPETPPLGVWEDFEVAGTTYRDANQCLLVLDGEYPRRAGVYSNGPDLNAYFDADQQAALSARMLWLAGYPNYLPTFGWNKGADHTLHQFTDAALMPGVPHKCDMSRLRDGLTWRDIMPSDLMPIPAGCLIGGHTQSNSDIIPVFAELAAAGAVPAIILSVEDPGKCVDARQLGVPTAICRFVNPSSEFEGGGAGRGNWPQDKRQTFADRAIQLIFDRTNPTERAAIDYYQCGYNEWDSQTPDEWLATADVFEMLVDKASARSAEYEQSCGRPLRLALPVFNAGTPKTWEMYQALAGHPLFAKMQGRGDLLLCHEGIAFDQPFDYLADGGPNDQGVRGHNTLEGAPYNPDAGLLNFRIDYLLGLLAARGVVLDYAIGEWYDGRVRSTDPADIGERIDTLKWLDTHLGIHGPATRAHCRGVCPFELTNDTSSIWYRQDFTIILNDPRWTAYAVSQIGRKNSGGAMPFITDADFANAVLLNNQLATIFARYAVHVWKAGDVALANTNPLFTYNAPGGTVHDTRPPTPPGGAMVTYDLNVIGVSADQLWIEVALNLWCKTADVKLKTAAP